MGENCEIDIDECAEVPCENEGECFERSDPSHWETDWEFNFAEASGYICQCQPGFAGEFQKNFEENIMTSNLGTVPSVVIIRLI